MLIRRRAVALVALGLVVATGAACSSSASNKPTVSPSAASPSLNTPTPTPTPAPTGPATAVLTLSGSAGIAGRLKVGSVACGLPGVDGSSIFLLAQPADKNVTVRLILTTGTVSVAVVSGAGTSYKSRTFTGTGATGFDPATGAQLDSKLAEVADPSPPGTLGGVTSIVGRVDCGNQRPGSTTLRVTGPTVAGVLAGAALSPAKVTCTKAKAGYDVQTIAVTQAGSAVVVLVINVVAGKFTVAVSPKSGDGEFFAASTGTARATSTAAQVNGTVTSGKVAAHVLHVTGGATCGNPATS